MDKIIGLKFGSFLLFWFGIYAEITVVLFSLNQISIYGYSPYLTPFPSDQIFHNAINFTYSAFAHLVAAFWLAKGTKKGVIFAISVSIFEIITFLLPEFLDVLFTYRGFSIRILFAVIIILIIIGRKELERLQFAHWRPWSNPKRIFTI